jgi:hypothetical protein
MQPSARTGRWWLWAIVGLAAVVVLVPFHCIVWDGGFQSVECRLKFVDNQGNPVNGVTLTVYTRAGGVCHFYPVDEFVPDAPVTSDADGWMVFHHTSRGPEFGGKEYNNLIGMRFGDTDAPRYDCVFTLDGREVFRTRYNFHRDEWKEFRRGSMTREWRSPGWDFVKYGWLEDGDDSAWRLRVFDTNKDGKLDREEAVAATHSGFRLEDDLEWVAAVNAGRAPEQRSRAKEITFLVVERTVAVPDR